MGVLSTVSAFPSGKPFEPSRKGLDIAQKAEARDDGPNGPAASKSKGEIGEAVRSAPGRGLRIGGLYGIFPQWQGNAAQTVPDFAPAGPRWNRDKPSCNLT